MAGPEDFLQRCGRFLLLERVAAGGMGEIFKARAAGSGGRIVAIKRLLPQAKDDPVFVGMFIDEARVASTLAHPNIARLYEFGEHEGSYFLAMEWVDGCSLHELHLALDAHGEKLSVDQAARVFALIAGALDHAHALVATDGEPLGLVHRDVSPANIMVTLEGQPKLLDFGLAKARVQLQKTQPGFVKGKFGYLAPEQLEGQIDARTDLFALGLCFYETLAGEKLFERPNAADTIRAIRDYRTPPTLRDKRPEVSEELEAVVRKALAPRPEDRFQSGGEMQRAIHSAMPAISLANETLDAATGHLVGRYYPERVVEKPPKKPRRRAAKGLAVETPEERKWRLALYAAAVVLMLLLCVILSAGVSC